MGRSAGSTQMKALVALLAVSAARAWPRCAAPPVNVSASAKFGIEGAAYADNAEACWLLRGGDHVTLVFDAFMTEYNHDTVVVYDGPGDDVGRSFSGELPTPFVVRSEATPALVRFRADETYHAEPRTKQVGFSASYFDSSDGSCANGCGGHGSCDDGLCTC